MPPFAFTDLHRQLDDVYATLGDSEKMKSEFKVTQSLDEIKKIQRTIDALTLHVFALLPECEAGLCKKLVVLGDVHRLNMTINRDLHISNLNIATYDEESWERAKEERNRLHEEGGLYIALERWVLDFCGWIVVEAMGAAVELGNNFAEGSEFHSLYTVWIERRWRVEELCYLSKLATLQEEDNAEYERELRQIGEGCAREEGVRFSINGEEERLKLIVKNDLGQVPEIPAELEAKRWTEDDELEQCVMEARRLRALATELRKRLLEFA